MSTGEPLAVTEWEPPPPSARAAARGLAWAALGGDGLVLGAALSVLPGVPLWLGLLLGVGAAGLWVAAQPRLALPMARARRLKPGTQPRFESIAAGLAAHLDAPVPVLYLIERGGPNALAVRRDGISIALTKGALDDFARTELEGVIAHCLVSAGREHARDARLAAALWPLPTRLVRGDSSLDARAASITRYPPALASAIAKAEPHGGRFGAFWFVSEGGGARQARIEALSDL